MARDASPADEKPFAWQRWHVWAFLGFVLVLSYLTFFHRYWNPPYVFWDENYHIASAQKYIHGVYFMEQHPPLGKLLVALGEVLLHPNEQTNQFLGTDYGTNFPEGFSFAGYRLFSALLAWWTAPVLFFCFYYLTRKNPLIATLFTFFYIFDNALVVHLRGAMLEGPLLFFSSCIFLFFLLLWEPDRWSRKKFALLSIFFGAALAMAMTTKVLGLIFILLIPPLVLRMLPTIQWIRGIGPRFASRVKGTRLAAFLGLAFASFLVVYCSVWYVHFARGTRINPALPDQGYYQASDMYKRILAAGVTRSPLAFPVMLRDSLKFVSHYNNGAPRLDLCKTDENGSPFFYWPLGARSINYRWQTPGDGNYSYLYLQANPAVWWPAFAGVLLGFAMVMAYIFFPPKNRIRNFPLLLIFLGMWTAYMLAVSRIDRVMYLYHYFLPLLFSFFVFAIAIEGLQTIGRKQITEQGRLYGMMGLGAIIFLSFQFYRPFTYYEPMNDTQVTMRSIFPLWELKCVNCETFSPTVVACREPGQ